MTHASPLKGNARGRLPFAPEGWPIRDDYDGCVKAGNKVSAGLATIIARKAGE